MDETPESPGEWRSRSLGPILEMGAAMTVEAVVVVIEFRVRV